MGAKKLLLVDFNNLLFRSVFAHSTLSYEKTFTGGLYGTIDMLSSAVNKYGVDRVLICYDTKPYFRSKWFPEYKADRAGKTLDEEDVKKVEVSRRQIMSMLDDFRFGQAMAEGFEADDFIGYVCRTYSPQRYSHIFIMSNDSDFYQLLSGRVFLCKTGGLYGRRQFQEDYPGIKPKQWPRCIALKGSHNGVPGIKGVGDKTAYKAVLNKMTDADIFDKWHMRRGDLKLRTDLSTFPFPLVSDPPTVSAKRIRYSAARMQKLCDKYGMRFQDEFHSAFMRLST